MKTGVIDVGGGLRGIYAAGVFDHCLDEKIVFDFGIGISAGSANLASYMSGQRGRNYKFYQEYSGRKEYMGAGNLLRHHTFINLDYIYGTLSNSGGENPLDYEAFMANPMEWYMAATNAKTGKPHYFGREDVKRDDYNILKASCAIPVVCPPQRIDGVPYYDGALGNPVPIQKAFDCGCDKVVLILTKPEGRLKASTADDRLARCLKHKYPQAAKQMALRIVHYNEGIKLAQEYAKEGKVLIAAPDDTCGVDTLTRDKQALNRLYEKGYKDAADIRAFIDAPA